MKPATDSLIRLIKEYIEQGNDAKLQQLHKQYSYRILGDMLDADDVSICDIIEGYFKAQLEASSYVHKKHYELSQGTNNLEHEYAHGDWIYQLEIEVEAYEEEHIGDGINDPMTHTEIEYEITNTKIHLYYD